jgi:hypothetical protein
MEEVDMPPPNSPRILGTSITVITLSTTPKQAREWLLELRSAYDEFYDNPDAPDWSEDDMDEVDACALAELKHIAEQSDAKPLKPSRITSFCDRDWRKHILETA